MIEDRPVDSPPAACRLQGCRRPQQEPQRAAALASGQNGGGALQLLNKRGERSGRARRRRRRKMAQSTDVHDDDDDDDDDIDKDRSIPTGRERHKRSPPSGARWAKQLVLIPLALLLFGSAASGLGWPLVAALDDNDYASIQPLAGQSVGEPTNSDNYTQIPTQHHNNNNNNLGQPAQAEPELEMDYASPTPSVGATSAPTTTSSTTAAAVASRRPAPKRPSILDSQLLPLSDFNVQQPPFSDLIKSWPPTTQQQQQHSGGDEVARGRARARQEARGQQQQQQSARNQQQQQQQPSDGWPIRNHLNEDLDDTILTADQAFELDQVSEPPSWINYLGDWADYIYVQLRQLADKSNLSDNGDSASASIESRPSKLKIETIDELLDDYYYDQYENSQVLYYGPQLVREGDMFEIGCYLPPEQPAEWTKSGRPLDLWESRNVSPRVARNTDFLNAKQNFSLKIFVALLSDSGNYRCNRMSRKYHKLVVVPAGASPESLYRIQQRLLSVVNPSLMSSPPLSPARPQASQLQRHNNHLARPQSSSGSKRFAAKQQNDHLIPGYLIVAGQPLIVDCNITDELLLRRLRENPRFQLAWFKNGKQLRLAAGGPSASGQHSPTSANGAAMLNGARRGARPPQFGSSMSAHTSKASPSSGGRLQPLLANGRRLFISSAQLADAGDYLCSWSELQRHSDESAADASYASPSDSSSAPADHNPLAAGSLVQLMAPVKLRPFKSAYQVRESNELRLVCLAQRGHPAAHISWYVGNQLVDGRFLRANGDEYRVLHLQSQELQAPLASQPSSWPGGQSEGSSERRIVEINPIPSSKQQMQLTRNGQWIEYHDFTEDRYSSASQEQQLRYLQSKLVQLSGLGRANSPANLEANPADQLEANLVGQASVSVLVIKSLNATRHSSRYACRATTRANTDEVTTVIRVSATSTISIKPSSGRATLILGQPLHLQCEKVGFRNAEFFWYRKQVGQDKEQLLEPGFDEFIEIHNDRIILHKPTRQDVGDYICRALERVGSSNKEDAVIRVRTQPYIEDFGIETSHTGQSSIVTDGDRLELSCTVSDQTSPVNITWLRSSTLNDERTMVPISETPASSPSPYATPDPFGPSTWVQESDIIIETLGSHSKRLVIPSVTHEHRSYYVCMADNGVTERARKMIYIRVKDKLVALWPFLGIVAELFILFTIIHIWETQRAYKEIRSVAPTSPTNSKRAAGGPANVRPADRDRKLETALLE